jgi:hypothetical protein
MKRMVTYNYEPNRLVRDGNGYVIENERAPLAFKQADARLAREIAAQTTGAEADKAQAWADLLTAEAELHRQWVEQELTKGRPESELTWGACVQETGMIVDEGSAG